MNIDIPSLAIALDALEDRAHHRRVCQGVTGLYAASSDFATAARLCESAGLQERAAYNRQWSQTAARKAEMTRIA